MLKVKKIGPLNNYIGCTITTTNNKLLITQLKLIEMLKSTFKDKLSRQAKLLATLNISIVQPSENNPSIDSTKQSEFKSGVGMLLYLVKHLRPHIAN